jgi:hypothetical protein
MPRYSVPDPVFRPITVWPGEATPASDRAYSRFEAGYEATLDLLKKELGYLEATDVVLQVDVDEYHVRRDGYLRTGAKPRSPGVIVAFRSKWGPQTYATDVFDDWQANLRAIALGLSDLRRIDRYGIAKRGEQYRGWTALPAGSGDGGSKVRTRDEAAAVILEASNWTGPAPWDDPAATKKAIRSAMRNTHPELHGGSSEAFDRVVAARSFFERV